MPGPSDIRVNPFNNATNYVNLTERHIIPSVSPFVVRLNEVPEKQDPSNMQMYYVDDTTGQTTETALTEVAATPGAGEFRPDYSTNAFDDTSWNTGLIEFSSSDAGKIIEVSYTATGTLAGVKTNRYPAWWIDRGDGSDGDFVPESNITISGLKQYKSVFIKAGVTVTVDPVVRICCQGAFVNQGTITANGQGASGGAAGFFGGAGGAGYNGGGASGGAIPINDETAELVIRNGLISIGGSGGPNDRDGYGVAGAGGGTVQIVTNSFDNTGNISADGNRGGSSYGHTGGGGGGGQVTVICRTLNSEGTITATGGTNYSGGARAGAGIAKIVVLE
ncbi:MAG: hypothetical protein DBY32_00960 [Phascolarctobacterium sp.]|nr:MAG: hypothetical protein DBY32_00960 [Phascolarctobacterium sp.]